MTRSVASPILVIVIALISLQLALPLFVTFAGQEPAESHQPGPQSGTATLTGGGRALGHPSPSRAREAFHGGLSSSPRELPSSGGNPTFFNPATYLLGGVYAFSMAVGDLNGDGKADLVVASECQDSTCTSGGVSVLLGNGDGTFQPAQSYSSGGYEAYAVAISDLNGDGKGDLIVANGCQSALQCTGGIVGVLLGNGDGTFQSPQSYSSGGVVASAVAVGDFNGDGKADVAVTNQCQDSTCASGSVSVLLGNGNGTLQTAQSYASGGLTAISVVIGDFNGDKKSDLAVADQCQTSSNCNGSVAILLGNGTGTFQTAQTFASGGSRAMALLAGDFNGDQKTDLAVAHQCQGTGNCLNGSVGVLLGNGDGTFQSAQNYLSGGSSTAEVAISDLNGDGHPDLVLTNQCQVSANCVYGSVSVLLGNGDGTFQAAQSYLSDGVFADTTVARDFNGDGKPDLAIANQCQTSSNCSGSVTVLFGNGDGTFQTPPAYPSGGYADSVAVGDLNGDGKLDLAVADLCGSTSCSNSSAGVVGVLLGNGNGTFQPELSYPSGGFGASSIALGDLNGDGKIDLAVANECFTSSCSSGAVSILLGSANGTFQAGQSYSSNGVTALSVAIGDFNKDGRLDLVVAHLCQDSSCQNGSVSVLLGNGDGTFQAAQTYSSGGYYTNSVAVSDFNADGNSDLALSSQCQDSNCHNGGVSILLGNGDGTFQAAQSYNSAGNQANSIAVTDLDADGVPDLVVANLCQNSFSCSNGFVSVLIGKGAGTFYGAVPYASGGRNTCSVVAADWNGDGYKDVAVANSDGTTVLLGNGDGTFQTPSPYDPGGIFLATGDLNTDGKPDMIVAGGSVPAVTVLLNITTGYRQATTTTLTSSPNPSSTNQSILFTATVAAALGGLPTGTVTFVAGATTLGTATVGSGSATLNYSLTKAGFYRVTATYSGDSSFLASTSAPLLQGVSKAATTTVLTSSLNPSKSGQTVQFTATLSGLYGGTPTGTVTFKDGKTVLSQVTLSSGVAQYKTSKLSKGAHHVIAIYGGDKNFQVSSGSMTQTVN